MTFQKFIITITLLYNIYTLVWPTKNNIFWLKWMFVCHPFKLFRNIVKTDTKKKKKM